ncbi:MAG: 4-hydroxy-tetrahydrodipicolinate reductase, partial [Methyloglobulus sp.]|nr:4-hydroxy-tetrahydrodipicolinate reductase [Methyloglobulus sp.]
MMRVAIVGASGRMGLTLIQAVTQSPALTLTVAIDRADSPVMGKDAGDIAGVGTAGVKVTDNLAAASDQFDVLIDFTRPDVSMDYLEHCRQAGKKMVIGTTGFSDAQKARIAEAAKATAIMMAPNMSVGVN